MKKITVLCVITCSLIGNTTFGMWNKSIRKPKNIIYTRQCNHKAQFNRVELLEQLEEQKHRFSSEQMIFLKDLIITQSTVLTEERIAMPGKAKDRDFPHGNMNKE